LCLGFEYESVRSRVFKSWLRLYKLPVVIEFCNTTSWEKIKK
jgi:hypothetical protein